MSFWGWGEPNRFPDIEARRATGELLPQLVGIPARAPEDPVPFDRAALSESRIEVPKRLTEIVDGTSEARIGHARGKSYPDLWRGFHGLPPTAPDAVAFPSSSSQIMEILEWCEKTGIAVVPFGGGTSVVGGVEPPRDRMSLSLSLARLDRVLEVDPISRLARIQAGATGPKLEASLGRHGMTLRHYPQSFEYSTLGGWIATRAAGHYATGPTRIDAFVHSVEMVSPAGTLVTRQVPSTGAGPDVRTFALGSEGTLGVITEAVMRVRRRPKFRARATARFATFLAGAEAVRALVQLGLEPSNCRLLDPVEAAMFGVAGGDAAILILAQESEDVPLDRWLTTATRHIEASGGEVTAQRSTESDRPEEDARWRAAFFEGPYLQNVMVSLGVVADTFETAVTWDRFSSFYEQIIGTVGQVVGRGNGQGRVSCRITHAYPDGPAPYFTFVAAPRRRGAELELWSEIKRAASDAVIEAGGTITHHHAVGRTHLPWHERERGPLVGAALKALKRVFDPHAIMNPGVLVL
ncbi:MAG: FAD-binding oxidoreductase [Deltaproteobacteria bacterium]|nr:FAD-binding oxidoreductase [Deltaproteobacteria bacterium]